jgi:hypothetical protein
MRIPLATPVALTAVLLFMSTAIRADELYRYAFPAYDDSHQPECDTVDSDICLFGGCLPAPRCRWKALRHEWRFTVHGPRHAINAVQSCATQAVVAGVVAAVFTGAAAGPVLSTYLGSCLGYYAHNTMWRFDDYSHWVYY